MTRKKIAKDIHSINHIGPKTKVTGKLVEKEAVDIKWGLGPTLEQRLEKSRE